MSEPKFVNVTHRVVVKIGDDGRSVEITRGDNGGYQFEWERPADDQGSVAKLLTKVQMSELSFWATIKGGIEMMTQTGELEGDDELSETIPPTDSDQDAIDAARYRAWRDNMLTRPGEVARGLATAVRDYEVDEAIDRLFR